MDFNDRLEHMIMLSERYQDGELFLLGNVFNEYPSINENKRVFNYLKKLYDLYNKFNRHIGAWLASPWNRLPIDEMVDSLVDYDNKCRKLPSGLKTWPTFLELKTKIDEWKEKVPLIELMVKNPLKSRHWAMIEKVTNSTFPIDNNSFTLSGIFYAPLLENKDELEDICQTAIKEIDIEGKLRQIISDWTNMKIGLTTFKARGMLLLKGQELGETVALLEDSQMIISSLASNR